MSTINPVQYDKTRNYLDGAVTWLSPFVTHGIISTVNIADAVLQTHSSKQCYRLLYELAWREYFHRVWEAYTSNIFTDMRNPSAQTQHELPAAVLNASTGITVIDQTIQELLANGTIHNHARMWIAALCCNTANTHWKPAAKWMHYHLLDGDLASNTLSWQWVAGTFSNKRYVANQENVNKYSGHNQQGTFLDVSYEKLAEHKVPHELSITATPIFDQSIPGDPISQLSQLTGTVALRSIWQLDASWQTGADHHVLFIEDAHHEQWPMSQNRWRFILHWARAIPNLIIVRGHVDQLHLALENANIVRQPYPACDHWSDANDERAWLYEKPEKNYKSFSQFWKQVQLRDG